MKKVITATGNEELSEKIKSLNNIIMVNQDIQYQEGIIEALDKYQDIDIIVIKDDIMGEMETSDLIRSIIILKNDIEIILITDEIELEKLKNVSRIISKKENYVKEVIKYLSGNVYIKEENATKDHILEEKVKQENCEIGYHTKKEKDASIITVIGKAGVRKNNIHSDNVKTNKKE